MLTGDIRDTFQTLEGKTTTVDLDVGESKAKSPRKAKKADVKPVPTLVTPEDVTPSKIAAVGANKDKTVRSVIEPPKSTTATPSAILKPSSELIKPTQIDVDSRRDREEFNVEIRTKPVFGRRSKFSELSECSFCIHNTYLNSTVLTRKKSQAWV